MSSQFIATHRADAFGTRAQRYSWGIAATWLAVTAGCGSQAASSSDSVLAAGAGHTEPANGGHSGQVAATTPAISPGATARASAAGSGGQQDQSNAREHDAAPATAPTAPAAANSGTGGHTQAGAHAAADGGKTADDAADAGAVAVTQVQPNDSAPTPDPKFLVPASGPCPEFSNGYVTFMPDGMARRVLLYIGEQAKTLDGPLIFSWHSTLPNPEDASSWIGNSVIEEIKAQGGLVAAPTTGYPNATRPWDNTPLGAQNTDGDQRLMDEVVACAIQKVGIDVRRIHATGMSAGGLKTAQVSLRRSGYLASVVVYSGGLTEGDMPPDQDPENKFAAMILYGGPSDISPVDGIDYTAASNRYLDLLKSTGRFGFLCNHGGGHSVPQDSQASAWRFLQDHPFGTSPSPYAQSLPSGFLRYCALQK